MENVITEGIKNDFNGELENYSSGKFFPFEEMSVSMGFCLVPLPRPDVNVRANRTKSAQAD